MSERVAVQNIVIKLDRNRESQAVENVNIVGVVEGVHRFRGYCLGRLVVGLIGRYGRFPVSSVARLAVCSHV
jgi:hypothetical protein